MTKRQWTPEETATLRERYPIDGPAKLAALLGRSVPSVSGRAAALGLHKPKRNFTPEEDAEIVARYPTKGAVKLAKEFGRTPDDIRQRARRLGVWLVERESDTVNSKFFDVLTPDSSYVLGFLCADGCVSTDGCSVHFQVTESDVGVIEYIKSVTGSQSKIQRIRAREQKIRDYTAHTKASVRISFGTRHMIATLRDHYGIVPNKTSRNIGMPAISDEMLPHFVRGLFDGDGTVHHVKKALRITLLGCQALLEQLIPRLCRCASVPFLANVKPHTGTHRVTWGAYGDVRAIYDWMYPKAFPFCLERKRRVFESFFAERPVAPKSKGPGIRIRATRRIVV